MAELGSYSWNGRESDLSESQRTHENRVGIKDGKVLINGALCAFWVKGFEQRSDRMKSTFFKNLPCFVF